MLGCMLNFGESMRDPETVALLIERAMRKAGGAMARKLGASVRSVDGDEGTTLHVYWPSRGPVPFEGGEFCGVAAYPDWWNETVYKSRQRMRRINELTAKYRRKREREEEVANQLCRVCGEKILFSGAARWTGKRFVHKDCWLAEKEMA